MSSAEFIPDGTCEGRRAQLKANWSSDAPAGTLEIIDSQLGTARLKYDSGQYHKPYSRTMSFTAFLLVS